LAGRQLVKSDNPEEDPEHEPNAPDNGYAYQDNLDVEFRLLPVRLLGYVKQASRRLKECSNAHDKPTIMNWSFDGPGLPILTMLAPCVLRISIAVLIEAASLRNP